MISRELWVTAAEGSVDAQLSRLRRAYRESPWDPTVLEQIAGLIGRYQVPFGFDLEKEEALRVPVLEKLNSVHDKWSHRMGEKSKSLKLLRLLSGSWGDMGLKLRLNFLGPVKSELSYLEVLIRAARRIQEFQEIFPGEREDFRRSQSQLASSPDALAWRKENPGFGGRVERVLKQTRALYAEVRKGRGPFLKVRNVMVPDRQHTLADFDHQLELDLYNARNYVEMLASEYYEKGFLDAEGYFTAARLDKIEAGIPELRSRLTRVRNHFNTRILPNLKEGGYL